MRAARVFWGIALSLVVAGGAGGGEEKMTIVDYFVRLPSETVFLEAPAAELVAAMRDGGRGIIDTRNGFMRRDGGGAQMSLQVALFRFGDGRPLLAVAYGMREEPDFTNVAFFGYGRGRMRELSRDILPVPNGRGQRFELPHHGRTIKVTDGRGRRLAAFTWDGGRFVAE